ncbi:hypothetical protein L198_00691 [Cryptococcus wingfieldii CBS 7118]|uniref:Uncharacterized protein n=1 Tax=Cryptococcus wingfieldii CBS 7118 TaxID=1295528 RepID=A0A1E3K9M8_9TREE|nr:hypothetical protein L198_00691 [Cryptococcus wingfieldii CBS 7118]ODO08952.1 hypothetical protein L198_00691 [Cryptococcus wingfieldii CBS 7118]
MRGDGQAELEDGRVFDIATNLFVLFFFFRTCQCGSGTSIPRQGHPTGPKGRRDHSPADATTTKDSTPPLDLRPSHTQRSPSYRTSLSLQPCRDKNKRENWNVRSTDLMAKVEKLLPLMGLIADAMCGSYGSRLRHQPAALRILQAEPPPPLDSRHPTPNAQTGMDNAENMGGQAIQSREPDSFFGNPGANPLQNQDDRPAERPHLVKRLGSKIPSFFKRS